MKQEDLRHPAQRLRDCARDLCLRITSEFIPFSRSRSAELDESWRHANVNWEVTVLYKGAPILKTPYTCGIGRFLPHFPWHRPSEDDIKRLWDVCERGMFEGRSVEPALEDVLWCLASDADALDYDTFEEWAEALGHDSDSRRAEKIWRQSVENSKKLMDAIGEEGLLELQHAGRDC